jgi:hypothetical protein
LTASLYPSTRSELTLTYVKKLGITMEEEKEILKLWKYETVPGSIVTKLFSSLFFIEFK